jgi:hypothetical protein
MYSMEEKADIDAIVRPLPSESWLREKTKDWPVEKFDFATDRVPSVCNREQWIAAKQQLKEFRAARADELIETRAIERESSDRRTAKERHEEAIKETRVGTDVARKTLCWTRVGVIFAVIAAILAFVSAVFAFIDFVTK